MAFGSERQRAIRSRRVVLKGASFGMALTITGLVRFEACGIDGLSREVLWEGALRKRYTTPRDSTPMMPLEPVIVSIGVRVNGARFGRHSDARQGLNGNWEGV